MSNGFSLALAAAACLTASSGQQCPDVWIEPVTGMPISTAPFPTPARLRVSTGRRVEVPAAAANHALLGSAPADRVGDRLVGIGTVFVLGPLQDVAVHVVEPPR